LQRAQGGDQAAHSYLIFETAAGFCGVAWNSAGITRFQLSEAALRGGRRWCQLFVDNLIPRSGVDEIEHVDRVAALPEPLDPANPLLQS
jgi:hypothetical protein